MSNHTPLRPAEFERKVSIMRQRRWTRLVRRGDWTGMAEHIRAVKGYDRRHTHSRITRKEQATP
jgi:predicted short-subunit dehydrogenase-like oxidoreductase (DUF2520 family)